MLNLLFLLLALAGLVTFVGYVWLTVVAFKRSVGWGLAVLLLSPFSAVFFVLRGGPEAKKPFWIYAGSILASLVLTGTLFAQLGGMAMMAMAAQGENLSEEQVAEFMAETMDEWEASGLVAEEDRDKMRQMRQALEQGRAGQVDEARAPAAAAGVGDAEDAALDAAAEAVLANLTPPRALPTAASRKTVPPPPPPAAPADGKLSVDDAESFVGRFVEVYTHGGLTHRGYLVEAGPGALTIEQRMAAGIVAFQVSTREVDWFEPAAR